jgi:hypothetical protein
VLVIITFRPEFTPPWVGRSHVTFLSLNRLPPRQRAEMIMSVTGGKALPSGCGYRRRSLASRRYIKRIRAEIMPVSAVRRRIHRQ